MGLSAGFSPGPLMTLVITQALGHGFKEGMKVAVAPLITDLPIIGASLFLFHRLAHHDRVLGVISLAGGVYVLYLAQETFRVKGITFSEPAIATGSLVKGVLTNLLNPSPYLFWTTVGISMISRFARTSALAPVLFIGSFLFVLVSSKILLAIIAGRSRRFLEGRGYVVTMRLLSLILAFFALLLLNDGLSRLWECC